MESVMRMPAMHLARELDISLKDLVRLARESLNFQINSASTLLREEQISSLRRAAQHT